MIFCPLVSGSSGNATYIASGKTRILVDCGRSGRQLEECLENIGVDARTLTHIFITHSHTDHTTGAGVLSRRYDIPIYCTLGTWNEMARKKVPGDVAGKNIQLFQSAQPDKTITLDDLQIVFFPLPHDTSDPVGYRISDGKATVAIATDIGYVSSHVHHYLMGADVVLLESNHDVRMLKNGSYTELLKARILSRTGHLSNESAGEFSAELIENGTRRIYLGHLSKENNTPAVAFQTVASILRSRKIEPGRDVDLLVSERNCPSLKSEI